MATADRMQTLDGLARSQAAYLRAGRSHVAAAAELAALPAVDTAVSVFVDSVEDAAVAVGRGATDLLLRDWTTDDLSALRAALAEHELVERTALPPGVSVDECRTDLPTDVLTAYLGQVDGSGVVRPRYEWAPGREIEAPATQHRFSAQWPDDAWRNERYELNLGGLERDLAGILERALARTAPTRDETRRLLAGRGDEVDAIAAVADRLRRDTVGDQVTVRGEPQHQLHQSVLFQVRVLRVLQGSAFAESARRAVPVERAAGRRTQRRSLGAGRDRGLSPGWDPP